MKKSFGERLRELRGDHSQSEVAKLLNTKQTTYSSWERNEKEPNINMIRAICDTFKISADRLFGLESENNMPFGEDDILNSNGYDDTRDLFKWDNDGIDVSIYSSGPNWYERARLKNIESVVQLAIGIILKRNKPRDIGVAFLELVFVLNGWTESGKFFSKTEVKKRHGCIKPIPIDGKANKEAEKLLNDLESLKTDNSRLISIVDRLSKGVIAHTSGSAGQQDAS